MKITLLGSYVTAFYEGATMAYVRDNMEYLQRDYILTRITYTPLSLFIL